MRRTVRSPLAKRATREPPFTNVTERLHGSATGKVKPAIIPVRTLRIRMLGITMVHVRLARPTGIAKGYPKSDVTARIPIRTTRLKDTGPTANVTSAIRTVTRSTNATA